MKTKINSICIKVLHWKGIIGNPHELIFFSKPSEPELVQLMNLGMFENIKIEANRTTLEAITKVVVVDPRIKKEEVLITETKANTKDSVVLILQSRFKNYLSLLLSKECLQEKLV